MEAITSGNGGLPALVGAGRTAKTRQAQGSRRSQVQQRLESQQEQAQGRGELDLDPVFDQ